MKKFLSYLVPAAALFTVASCSSPSEDPKSTGTEYMPDMYRGPAYETYSMNPNFKDSMTSRQPVTGTIARGNAVYTDVDRQMSHDYMMSNYPQTPEGYEAAGSGLKNPVSNNELNLAEGKRLYENYCLICHGATGQGDGPVVQRNGPKPPAYTSEQLKDLAEGKMYHSIHYGKNMMGSHASQLTPTQRWTIIRYVQTLQRGGSTSITDTTKVVASDK
ncbi:MAG: c-type cytochrome [Bacteroidota bacterium]